MARPGDGLAAGPAPVRASEQALVQGLAGSFARGGLGPVAGCDALHGATASVLAVPA